MRAKGQQAELQAIKYLQRQGLKLIRQNYSTVKGEIDLIMTHAKDLVFIEVRSKAHNHFGSAEETIDWRKQQRIIKCADEFCQRHQIDDLQSIRFDIIAIHAGEISWIKDAFAI